MSESSDREQQVFADALALPNGERQRYLDEACKGDENLRRFVEALLRAHEAAGPFMEGPSPLTEKAGDVIGRYKLLQKIGEGGCGVVWMAEQEEPVRRRIALKIIKLGMDTKEVIARFDAERQALAMMDHPNIARIMDAGATSSGRPYFVMELVRGIPVTEFCDKHNLSTAQRLDLFSQICRAVQHAHQKGIIHRDLKPSNILVTLHDGVPVPKVIDFGISKAMNGRLTDQTLFTAFEQFIGTPAYMSPEQAELSGLDIDTRSDIYSLGVLLYELLTGRPPFDPKSLLEAGLDEIRRIIRDVEPPRPSKNLSTLANSDQVTVARQRATDPANLSVLLRGDLDWIVMRCLEKDRSRRYETANGLALDIRRYLENEPVAARPPSKAYVLGKMIRRNKGVFIAGAGIGVVLVAGILASTWEAIRASRAERSTALERARVEDLLTFMLGDLHAQLAKVGRLEVLESAADKAMAYYASLDARELNDTSLAQQAKALTQIGEIRIAQANYGEATDAFVEAYRRAAALSARHPQDGGILFDRGQAEYWQGFVHWRRGELALAAEWMKRYYDTAVSLVALDPERPEWQGEVAYGLHNMAVVGQEGGDLDSARSNLVAELAVLEKLRKADPGNLDLQKRLADAHSWLADIAERKGNYAEAKAEYGAQASEFERIAEADPRNAGRQYSLANAVLYEAAIAMVTGDYGGASRAIGRAQSMLGELVARDPSNLHWKGALLNAELMQAVLAKQGGDLHEAERLIDDTLPKLEQLSVSEPTDRKYTLRVALAWRLRSQLQADDRAGDAEASAEHAVAIGEKLVAVGRAVDADIGEYAEANIVSGLIALKLGKREEARRFWSRALGLLAPRVEGSRDWRLLDPYARAASLCSRHGESDAAKTLLQQLGYVPVEPWPVVQEGDTTPLGSERQEKGDQQNDK